VLDANSSVVIVGASLAGTRAAETLRAEGHSGSVTVLGAERHPPYDRPPLSKQFLAGTWGLDRVLLRSPDKLGALGLELRLGRSAVALDVAGHAVEVDDGSRLHFDGLVVATGAHPRRLPGAPSLEGVHTLRTLEDSLAIGRSAATEGARVVVVGAGFIGSEVAATCRMRGADVTIVEALPAPLAGVLGLDVGAACAALHAQHGVRVVAGVGVSRLAGDAESHVTGVVLDDGTVLDADAVVVGIGVRPTTRWLEDSGLELFDGVVADATLFAADDVVVAGDVARWFAEDVGAHVRIEHWTNAAEQGVVAARNLLVGRGAALPYVPVPYFWSDQYDVKIQMIGHPDPNDDVEVVDGSFAEGRFVALYGRAGRLRAAVGFNRPRQLMRYRPLLESGASFAEALSGGLA
jgi:3-phenylpropionate/trans-cinnamate dioxygenase ferredoxin reductase subunit